MPTGRTSTIRPFALASGLAGLCCVLVAGGAYAQSLGRTTGEGTIVQGPPLDPAKPSFLTLATGPGQARAVRELPRARAQSKRYGRRRSLAYFAQLSDFQLVDEESPARVELNAPLVAGSSSWRPQEALLPAVVDLSIRQVNHFTAASPNRGAGGRRAAMDFAVVTGDQSDNQQENEVTWVRQLLEGGRPLDPNSGTSDYSRCTLFERGGLNRLPDDEGRRYTGVQDHGDYNGGSGDEDFYDPNRPGGPLFVSWPQYQGLMDRAQRPFVPSGLHRGSAPVPTYVANGNHDLHVQGNTEASASIERIATSCFKPFLGSPPRPFTVPEVFHLGSGFPVPPDERRRFVDRVEVKRIYGAGSQRDAHGFAFVDPAQNQASGFSAGYYAWDPKPGVRFIALDTISEGGGAVQSPQGNIDDPQFQWLRGELARAKAERKIVILFGHHAIRTITSATPDEALSACSGRYSAPDGPYTGSVDRHGHDRIPGCDLDPRSSSPVHLGSELAGLLSSYGNAIAYVSGHAHANRVLPCGSGVGCPRRGNWWEITTSATADWPQQSRLLELMDNRDGTLSLVGTAVDQGGAVPMPLPSASPQAVDALNEEQLAGIARTFGFNDPREPKAAAGRARDRNVELIVADPRAGRGAGVCALARARIAGKRVDRARLSRRRAPNRRAYPPLSLVRGRGHIDRFCIVGGGQVRVGYPSGGVLGGLTRGERRRGAGRAVVARSSSPRHRVRGLRTGSRLASVRKRLAGERRFRVGRDVWYLAWGRSARVVVRVRRSRVAELGLADLRLTLKKNARRLLRSLY